MRRRPRVRAASTAGRGQGVAQRGDARGAHERPGTRRPPGRARWRRRWPPPRTPPPPRPARRSPRPTRRRVGTRAPARRVRSAPATTIGSPRRTARTTSWSGSRVCSEQPPAGRRGGGRRGRGARAPARRPGPAAPAAPGRARGTRPGRRAAAGGTPTRPRPTRWSTASVPTSTGTSGTASVDASTDATSTRGSNAARSSRTRAIPGRTARNVLPWQWRHTDGRAVVAAARRRTRRRVARPSRRTARTGPAPGTSGTRGAAPARGDSARTLPARRDRRRGGARRPTPRSTPRDPVPRRAGRRPPPAASGPRRPTGSPTATSASTVGAGVSTRSAAPARRARSTATSRAFQVGARSSSSASSPSSTTTTAREVGHRRPHRGAPADHHARAGAGAVPVRGADRVGMFRTEGHDLAALALEMRRHLRRTRARRVDHHGRALGRDRHVDRGARPDQLELLPVQRRAGVHGLLDLDRVAGGDDVRRRRRPQEARQRARPPPRRPAAEVDDVGRRPAPTPPRAPRAARCASGSTTSASSTQPRTRRPCSGTRTIVPTRTAPANRSSSWDGSE